MAKPHLGFTNSIELAVVWYKLSQVLGYNVVMYVLD